MRYIVLGMGAVGGVVAARLHLSGAPVIGVARGDHGQTITRDGLAVATPAGRDVVHVETVETLREARPCGGDVILLAVKGQDTDRAIDEILGQESPDLTVACLQNGVANEMKALRWFAQVLGVAVYLPSTFLRPGEVASHSEPTPGILDVGRWPQGETSASIELAEALAAAGFSSVSVPDISRWKHGKLINNLTNVVDALCGGPARHGPLGRLAMDEGRAVLDRVGIPYVSEDEQVDRRHGILDVRDAEGQPRAGSSSWQSLARQTGSVETDYLNGEIVRLGRAHGLATPVNEALQRAAQRHVRDMQPPGSILEEELLEAIRSPGGSS